MARPLKIIIDTDPGVDDTFAILLALRSPEVEVVGITSLFGNVRTKMATQNALYILEKFGRPDIPVYEGHHTSIVGEEKGASRTLSTATTDSETPIRPRPRERWSRGKSAAEFIVETANAYPGEVTVVALASATNVTLCPSRRLRRGGEEPPRDRPPGGAFFVNGNVNPSAEANIFGDPVAADELYGSGANVTLVGLDVTQRLTLAKEELEALGAGGDQHAEFLMHISRF